MLCGKGLYYNSESASCQFCGLGAYSSSEGTTSCIDCAVDHSTVNIGSTGVGQCVSKYILCSKTCLKQSLSKRQKIGFGDQLLLNAGQKYCRMLQGEHSAILLTFIKLPFVIKIFVLSIFV